MVSPIMLTLLAAPVGKEKKLPSGREFFDTNSFCRGCFGESCGSFQK